MTTKQFAKNSLMQVKNEIIIPNSYLGKYSNQEISNRILRKIVTINNEIFNLCMNEEFDWTAPNTTFRNHGEIEITWKNKQFNLTLIVQEISDIIIFVCKNGNKKFYGGTTNERIQKLYMSCVKKSKINNKICLENN